MQAPRESRATLPRPQGDINTPRRCWSRLWSRHTGGMVQQLQLPVQVKPTSKQHSQSTPHVFVPSSVAFDSQSLGMDTPVHQLPTAIPDQQLDHINQILIPPTPFVWMIGVPKMGHAILQRLVLLHTSVLLLLDARVYQAEQALTEHQLAQMHLWVRRLTSHHGYPQIHMA